MTFVLVLIRLFGGSCPGARGAGVGGERDNIVSFLVNLRLGGGAGLDTLAPIIGENRLGHKLGRISRIMKEGV